MTNLSRRSVLGLLGGGAAAAAATGGFALGATAAHAQQQSESVVPFTGLHQAGIATPVQDRMHFVAFDVVTDDRSQLIDLLQRWTDAARRLTQGWETEPEGATGGAALAPPQDTGEALGLSASRLTLTIGFGPSLFDDRFGLRDRRPDALAELPRFAGDALEPDLSDGDLCIQACADDPQVAVHAVRNLARMGFGVVRVRYAQLGFGKTSSTTPADQTPRNLFGFKDGTANISGRDAAALAEHVWVAPEDGPEWMVGGSYAVTRRIRMLIETWDRTSLAEQEAITGRTKREGAPIGGRFENDPVNLEALDTRAHVRLAHPESNGGIRILRRGYSFTDGVDALGRLDAGLFFVGYQRDPRRQFVPLQRRLAAQDGLNEYLRHTGSGVWAIPPGVAGGGGWWGQPLFAST